MLGNLPRACWVQHSPFFGSALYSTLHNGHSAIALLLFCLLRMLLLMSEFHEVPFFYPSKQSNMYITYVQVYLCFLASEKAKVIATLLVVGHVPNSAAVKGDLWVF